MLQRCVWEVEDHLARAGRRTIEEFVKDELAFIECLAFTGLHNDVIEFTSEHLNSVSEHFSPSLLPDKTLPSLSLLRTSAPYQNIAIRIIILYIRHFKNILRHGILCGSGRTKRHSSSLLCTIVRARSQQQVPLPNFFGNINTCLF